MEKDFFCDEPFIIKKRRVKGEYNRLFGWDESYEIEDEYSIEILQVLVFGNNQYLVEYELGDKK